MAIGQKEKWRIEELNFKLSLSRWEPVFEVFFLIIIIIIIIATLVLVD